MTLSELYESIINSLYYSNIDIQATTFYPDWIQGDTEGNIVINGKSYPISVDMSQDDFNQLLATVAQDIISPSEDNVQVEEDLTESEESTYPALLVALDSEREAEVTYKTLIENEESSESPRQEVIELLKKILDDEMEHIALLSALQANLASEFVGEDAKADFNEYVDDIDTN